MSPRPSECWVPNGKAPAYLPVWLAQLTDHPAQKVGWAAIGAVAAGFMDAINVVAIVTFGFWVLDFLSGTIRAIRAPDEELRWDKAGDSVLKLALYLVMWMLGVLGDLLVVAIPPHIETHGALAGAACAVIISMELTSIRYNVVKSLPAASGFFDRVRRVINRTEGDNDASPE